MTEQERDGLQTIQIDDILEVTIEKIVYGGDGLARIGPAVILVPFTAPEERVRVRIVSVNRRVLRGVVEELISRSPARVTPRCSHFGVCGGCHLQHLDDQTQIEIKTDFIRESLRRIGGIEWQREIRIISGPATGYRARTELKIVRDDSGHPHLGYFRAGSHTLCELESCPILDPAVEREIGNLREHPERIPRSATRIYITTGDNGTVAVPATGEDRLRSAIDAQGTIQQHVLGIDYHFGARSFFQGNRLLLERLVANVIREVGGDRAIDLYAGVGLFSLQLAARFGKVCAVEGSPIAAAHGVQNGIINKITNIEYHSLTVEAWLKHRTSGWEQPDLILLDPPRAGAGDPVCQKIAALAPLTIRYVSCDPTTLARDLKTLCGAGYQISDVTLVDMFPQTFHVETVVTLNRSHSL